jgi:hypothetical protein
MGIGLGCGSSDRTNAWQVQDPEFKAQYCKTKTKNTETERSLKEKFTEVLGKPAKNKALVLRQVLSVTSKLQGSEKWPLGLKK